MTLNLQPKVKYALAGTFLWLSLLSWVFASPSGSSPDEFYHVGSSWCVHGESDTCKYTSFSTTNYVKWAEVPYSMDLCFVPTESISASCGENQHPETQPLPVASDSNLYPKIYYYFANSLLRFAGDTGIHLVRIANSLILIFCLFFALLLSNRKLRAAVITAFFILAVPQGQFIIASFNPSSWAFTGLSLNWVFFYNLITLNTTNSQFRKWGSVGLFAFTLTLASARFDSLVYAIILNLLIFSFCFDFKKRFLVPIILLLSSLAAFGFFYANSMIRHVRGNLSYLLAIPEFWGFTRYWLIHFIEIPLTSLGLNYGTYGPTGVITPPVVGHIQFGFLAVALTYSALNCTLKQFALGGAVSLLLFLVILQQNSIFGETGFYMVQGRYFLPLIVGAAGIFVTLSKSQIQFVQVKSIRTVVIVLLSTSNLLAFFVFVRRYSTGYDNDYRRFEMDIFKNFGLPTGWQYFDFLNPPALILTGSISYFVFTALFLQFSDDYEVATTESNPETAEELDYSLS